MNAAEAKKHARQALEQAGAPFEKLTARRVDFTDLARDSAYFVTVYGAQIGEHNALAAMLVPKGVILKFDAATYRQENTTQ